MNTTMTIPLQKSEKERLTRVALTFGLSLPEFAQKILSEIARKQYIPEESFLDYENPKALKNSFDQALVDFKTGRTSKTL